MLSVENVMDVHISIKKADNHIALDIISKMV